MDLNVQFSWLQYCSVFSHPSMDIDFDVTPSHDMHEFESSLEKLHGINFSLKEQLEPMIFHEVEEVADVEMPSNESHQTDGELIENPDVGEPEDIVKSFDEEQTIEKLRGNSVPLKESPCRRICSDRAKGSQTDEVQIKNVDSGINAVGPEKFDKEQNVGSVDMEFPEMASSSNQITTKHFVPMTIDSKFTGGSGIFMTLSISFLPYLCDIFVE